MSGLSGRSGRWSRLVAVVVCIFVVGVSGCECEEEPEEDETTMPEEVPERDRADEIPEPEMAGVAPEDFDPEDRSRVVEPDQWETTVRAAGEPGAMPSQVVLAVDRPVVRRGRPDIGPGTVVTAVDEQGDRVALGELESTDGDRVFTAEFEDRLEPGASYEITFETIEFDFGQTEEGDDDIEIVEFDDPPETVVDAPSFELLDISSLRPVGSYGHVELRFSAPVDARRLDDHLEWNVDGATPAYVNYQEVDDSDRVVSARIRRPYYFDEVNRIELTGGDQLSSTLGGAPLGGLEETIEVGVDSNGLEIREIELYERAGDPTVRVVCHDPNVGGETSYWDREISTRIRDLSRRCDVDSRRALQLVELDVQADVSVVDHRHGFDLVLDLEGATGPVGLALRTGRWGEHVAELYEGRDRVVEPSPPGPELAIDADGRYLEREDWDRVPIRHRDVEMARVVVRHASGEHFAFWLSGGDQMGGAASFAIAEDYIELDPGPAQTHYSYIDMEELVGEPEPGAYQVEVSAPYQGRLDDSHRFIVSDIQLLAKRVSHTDQEVDEVWTWTIDAESAEPIADVDLELIRDNGRVLADCETDEEGFCELSGNWGDLENEPPMAVVAEGVDELAYVDWEDTRTEVVEGEIGGRDYDDDPPYSGALRGERTLYRPGETMHFAGFVRGDQYRAEPGVPVGVEITDARGQEAYTGIEETDEVGTVEFDYELGEMASTGNWEVELFAGDEEIASQYVTVEEFVPERIDVGVDLRDRYVLGADGITGRVDAEYFFGTAAADAEFEVECRFEPTAPFDQRWPQYEFGPFDDDVESTTAHFEGTLDADGEARFSCNPEDRDKGAFYAVDVEVAVFEAGSGTPSRTTEDVIALPTDQMVGLYSPDDRVDRDDGARLEGIVVGPSGDVVDDAETVDLDLGSIRYSTTRVYRGGRTHWERERHESIDDRRIVDLEDGRFTIRAAARGTTAGLYFRAERGDAVTEYEVDAPRRWWGWGQRELDPRPDEPTHLEIDGPDQMTVGEPAEFSFEAPVDGRALVALETDRVESWEWIDVEAGTNSWETTAEYFDPNVYVSALYVPVGQEVPEGLDRGFGVRRVEVDRSRWEADVDLEVPDEREPGETLEVDVSSPTAGPEARAAVAVVDRGISSMATREFEDPLEQLFSLRALGVDTFDTVGWYADVSPEQFGGGAAVPPAPAPEAIMPVEPTAMWSGLVDLDEHGRASLEFTIPDFRGEVEIVAVVVDEARLGEETARTTVREPLTLQATAPRFGTHGDEMRIPASVTNTTDETIEVDVGVEPLPDITLFEDDTAALEVVGDQTASLELEPEQRGEVLFDIEVVGRAGVPELMFEATGGGEQSNHVATVPVYPDGPTEIEREHHGVDDRTFDVGDELDGWLPTSETTEIWVTSVPRAPAFEHLEHVLHYPRLRLGTNLYNTVARTRPLVFLDRLLEAASPGEQTRSVDWRVSRGIRGVDRLQNSAGRFTFWANGTGTVGPWGQAFVLDMLTSAQDAGHDVPEWVVRDGLDWLDRRVQRRHDIEDLDLAIWVLARQGRPNRRAARRLLEELPDTPSGRDHERALLATAALYLAGDETVEDDLRELLVDPNIGDRDFRWFRNRYSAARHEGLILEVAIEVFGPDDELHDELVEQVADRLVDAEVGELNLQELGWSIAALGRWAQHKSGQIPKARLVAAGSEVDPDVVGDDGSRSWSLHRASEYPDVTLEFDEQPTETVSVFRRTEGVHEEAQPEIGNENIVLSRQYRDRDGNRIGVGNLEVGDVVYVELEASHLQETTLRDLALVDRIPGGFEIENPRPEGELRPDWYDESDEWDVDHFDVRDDRLEAYGSIREDETVQFVYSLRATTAGTFSTPPAELTSMYQRDRWSRIAGRPVDIERP